MGSSKDKDKRYKTILVAFDWFDNRVYKGIAKFCSENDWHLSPYLFSDRNIPENWSGDGVITSFGPTLGDFILSLDMPKVDITLSEMPQDVPRVVVDNDQIGRLAAKHFLEKGYKTFGYFSWEDVGVNQIRKAAFLETLRSAGVDDDSIYFIKQPADEIIHDWDKYIASIQAQMRDLPRPIGIFTGQDNLGVSMIEACVRDGISVPEEVAVLGVDNIDLLCECSMVPLSSVDTNLMELGYAAAQQLKKLLDGEIDNKEPVKTVAIRGVVDRRSTEMLAVEHPKVAKALELMRSGFKSGLVLEDVYEHSGLSKRGLEKAFKRYLNDSPASILRKIRLDYAKNCLSQTDIKIEAIAVECGYSNSSNLSHAFKREIGISPQEYRNEFRSPLFQS